MNTMKKRRKEQRRQYKRPTHEVRQQGDIDATSRGPGTSSDIARREDEREAHIRANVLKLVMVAGQYNLVGGDQFRTIYTDRAIEFATGGQPNNAAPLSPTAPPVNKQDRAQTRQKIMADMRRWMMTCCLTAIDHCLPSMTPVAWRITHFLWRSCYWVKWIGGTCLQLICWG
uniref:Uncharacterized protein n=1 Tax=Arundo donax TaxID=35708 RepID=A0A0A9DEV2_ARUDO